MTHLPYGRQTIDDDDLAAVAEALHAPRLTCDPLVAWFEAALAGWPGAPETLAEAVAPGIPRTTVGIRPGEKLHETLISAEEVRRTSDLGDVLVIWPGFQFHGTLSGVRPGTPVPDDFVYSSDRAEPRLDLEATRAMVERVA